MASQNQRAGSGGRLRRREVLRGLVGVAATASFGAACGAATVAPSATTRKYRVGYLKGRGVPPCDGQPHDWQVENGFFVRTGPPTGQVELCPETVFLKALADRGFWLGRNLELIVATAAQATTESRARAAAELVARQVDLIVTESTDKTIAARAATTTIPIVMYNVGDVVDTGLVPNLARPGGNITGVAMSSVDMALKRVELLKEAFPSVKRPILAHAPNVAQRRTAGPAVELAGRLGLVAHPIQMNAVAWARPDDARAVEDSANAMKALDAGADSLVVIAGTPSASNVLAIVKQHRLPAVFNAESYMNEGGALLLDDLVDMVAVADYAARILNGTKPGDLPVLRPTNIELVINLKAAEALGTTIAPSVVARATRVVK